MVKNYMFLMFFLLGSFILQPYKTVGGDVSRTNGPFLFDPPGIANVFEFTVNGTVTSETGEPMPGVNVLEKGTTNGAVTDSNGKYAIAAASGDAILVFSFIGYTTKEVSIGNRSTIDLSLEADLTTLQEVVVVGYGTQPKRDVTGATSTVKADEIVKRPITRVEQALQGTTPGVVVSSSSGQPGNPLSVRIRGSNSISGNNNPLYVIDGYVGGNIESINPNDIESLEILKDASATAIYGSRGSNGVVIITTKTGATGVAKVNFGMWFSKASIPNQLDIMNAYEFATTVNAQYAITDPASTDKFTDAQLEGFRLNGGGTDWQDALQEKPMIQNYQLDLSGGSDNVKYLFSLNQLDQPGLILNQYYKRTTFRTNIDVKLNKKLDVGFKIVALMPQSRNTGYQGDLTDPFSEANIWDPTSPIRDPATGQYIKGSIYGSRGFNPVAQANNQLEDNRTTSLTGIGTLTYHIFKDLTFTSINSYEIQSQFTQSLRGLETSNGVSSSDYASGASSRYRSYQNSNFLTYNHKFGEHALTVTALYEQQNRLNEGVNARSVNLSTYSLGYYNLSLGSTQQTSSSYWADALQSFMGRVNYSFMNRYLLTASIRTDGSSHLTDKYSTFPSVAVGWNLTNESFLQDSELFAELKLRASWGKTGNQAVDPYSTIAQINTGGPHPNYYFDGTTPSVSTPLGSPVSPSLKWETTEQVDIGLDASFLENRLTFTADVYKKDITDLLYSYQAPFYMGGGNYSRNIGTIENKGLELSLKGIPVSTNALKWNSYFTISFNRNRVVDLGGLDNVQVNNIGSAQTGASLLKVGRPLGEFYGYQFQGTWKTSEAADAAIYGRKPGDSKFADINNDGVINSDDLTVIGNGTPDFSFGFINDVTYRNFTLSFMFQGTQGNQIYSQTLAYLWGGQGQAYNATTREALNVWTPENENDVPSFSKDKNFINSSRYVYDGSYIKLKNISLSYNIPALLLSKVKLRSLEIYGSAQNILWITDYPGYDPEVSNSTNAITQGLEMGVIPNPRTYTMGLRVGF
ncbi:MAG TPA: TonB-dependent receptor [Chryseolinea sp.]|nr:TonB-dependent receptor [Chryseolinea sp.]